jgi:hypothetical protein
MTGGLSIIWTPRQAHDVNPTASQPRSIDCAVNQRGEPDALTAHVRFWEGAVLN